ncbi:hypothetical protein J6590_039117 [Homalodisca vitripennis]|nr:hypothetical protein J6590_039117 [Homalodisca vitripennis]
MTFIVFIAARTRTSCKTRVKLFLGDKRLGRPTYIFLRGEKREERGEAVRRTWTLENCYLGVNFLMVRKLLQSNFRSTKTAIRWTHSVIPLGLHLCSSLTINISLHDGSTNRGGRGGSPHICGQNVDAITLPNLPLEQAPDGAVQRVQRLSQDNQTKQRLVWMLLGWVTAERSCPCKQPACPTIWWWFGSHL